MMQHRSGNKILPNGYISPNVIEINPIFIKATSTGGPSIQLMQMT